MSNNNDVNEFGYKSELKRSLTVKDLAIYGMIFMVPIAPFGIFGYTYADSKGMIALTYLVGLVAMYFTALSYGAMSSEFPIAGSVYSYAQRGISKVVGFFAGWMILLDYILVPALLYVVSASALEVMLPEVPRMVWIVVFIIINTVINILGVEFTAKANKIMLIAQLIVLAIFLIVVAVSFANGTIPTSNITIKPFYNQLEFSPHFVMAAVSIAVLSFLGFDGISTLAEETENPRKNVGVAILVALFVVGTLFILQTMVAAWVQPDYTAFKSQDNAFYEVAFIAGGKWLSVLCAVATVISWGIANALAAQAATSRILFSMARDKWLPSFLAKVHPKYQTPYMSTLFVGGISLIVGLIFSNRIDTLSTLVNFGALIAFLVLHVSVIRHYLVVKKSTNYLRYLVTPIIGFLIIGYVLVNLAAESRYLGMEWFIVGVVYFLIMKYGLKRSGDLDL